MKPFVLVTGNLGKIAEARLAVGGDLETVLAELPEIQSLDYLEIVHAKADEAWRQVGRPLIVEEAGLDLAALNGFPGPLVKWMLKAVGAEGLSRTAAALGDLRATSRCFLLYKDGDEELIAEGRTAHTFAELAAHEKNAVSHRGKAWREMMRMLGAV